MRRIPRLFYLLAVLLVFTALLLGLPSWHNIFQKGITLVDQGRPVSAIVIAAQSSRPIKLAAAEFQHYVKKITDVELPVLADNNSAEGKFKNYVLIGESAQTTKLGFNNSGFQRQEYMIRTAGNCLVLLGHDENEYGSFDYQASPMWPGCVLGQYPPTKDDRVHFKAFGSLYAVHTFLEKFCGVRWYLPTDLGEVLPPSTNTLAVPPIDLRLKPWTVYRENSRVYGALAPFNFNGSGKEKKSISSRDDVLWALRLKRGGNPFYQHHGYATYYQRFSRSNPEYFANGKPEDTIKYGQLCYANQGLVQQVVQDARDYFNGKYPEYHFPPEIGIGWAVTGFGDYFSLQPIDGDGSKWCKCPKCSARLKPRDPHPKNADMKLFCGFASDYIWSFANQVAREVHKSHPGKWLVMGAYESYFLPPDFKIEPNLAVNCCKSMMNYNQYPENKAYFSSALRAWSRRTKELYVWEYYLNQGFHNNQSFPWIVPHAIAEDIALLKQVGVKGKFFELSGVDLQWANMAEDLLPVYVTFKLLADSSRTIDEILDEHYRLFYGPAEQPMKTFFEKAERAWLARENWDGNYSFLRRMWTRLCPPEEIKIYSALIEEAKRLATSDPYAARVRLMEEAVYKPMAKRCLTYQQSETKKRTISCLSIDKGPFLDGQLDDQAWLAAAKAEDFKDYRPYPNVSRQPPVITTARMVRDRQYLYVAFECLEPEMNRLKATATHQDDRQIYLEDDVELFLDIGKTRYEYYHLAINSDGVLADRAVKQGGRIGVPEWNSDARVAMAKGKGGWSVEIAISINKLKEDAVKKLGSAEIENNEEWGINFCRVRRLAPEAYVSWAPLESTGMFNAPDDFGTLMFNQGKE